MDNRKIDNEQRHHISDEIGLAAFLAALFWIISNILGIKNLGFFVGILVNIIIWAFMKIGQKTKIKPIPEILLVMAYGYAMMCKEGQIFNSLYQIWYIYYLYQYQKKCN